MIISHKLDFFCSLWLFSNLARKKVTQKINIGNNQVDKSPLFIETLLGKKLHSLTT
jgi:hypothetical protein